MIGSPVIATLDYSHNPIDNPMGMALGDAIVPYAGQCHLGYM